MSLHWVQYNFIIRQILAVILLLFIHWSFGREGEYNGTVGEEGGMVQGGVEW